MLYGCGRDYEDSQDNLDTGTPVDNNKNPEIVYTFPENEQRDIAHDERIIIRFSEAIDQNNFWSSIYFSPVIDLTDWTPSWSRNEVKLNPPIGVKPFDLNSEYTLMVPRGAVVDLFGNSMTTDHVITFKTLRYPVEEIKGGITFAGKVTPI